MDEGGRRKEILGLPQKTKGEKTRARITGISSRSRAADASEARFGPTKGSKSRIMAKSSQVKSRCGRGNRGNAPVPLRGSGRVLRGQVVLGSKNFCRGIDPHETRDRERKARKPACATPGFSLPSPSFLSLSLSLSSSSLSRFLAPRPAVLHGFRPRLTPILLEDRGARGSIEDAVSSS